MSAKEFLRSIIGEGEAIYRILRDYPAMYPVYVIGPQTEDREDPGRYLDISGCIEDTLHRVLEAGGDVWQVLNAEKYDPHDPELFDEFGEPYDEVYEIDLGYGIFGFYPMGIMWVEDYEEPTHRYVLGGTGTGILEFEIPESMCDEDILGEVCKKVPGLRQDETMIRDLHGDGSEYSIEPLPGGKQLILRLEDLKKTA